MAKGSGKKAKKGNVSSNLGELTGHTLAFCVAPGLVVGGLSLAIRELVGGWIGSAMLVPALLGLGYALVGLGGVVMFVVLFAFLHAVTADDDRPIRRVGVVWIVFLFLTIPLSAVVLSFDRDQWVWGVGSAAVGFAIVVYALVVLPSRDKSRGRPAP